LGMKSGESIYLVVGTGKLATAAVEYSLSRGKNVIVFESELHAFSNLAKACEKYRIPYFSDSLGKRIEKILESNPGDVLIISAYNGYIFPKQLVDLAEGKIINFHNSLLPYYRGRNAPSWVIMQGETTTGITWHQVTPEIDKGHVLLRSEIQISENETALSLTNKTLNKGIETLEQAVSLWDNYRGVLSETDLEVPTIPPHAGFRLGREIPNSGTYDPKWEIEKGYRFLRAVDYGPFPVFPKPQISIENQLYLVMGYKFQENVDSNSEPESQIYFKEETPHITFKNSQGQLTLRLETINA